MTDKNDSLDNVYLMPEYIKCPTCGFKYTLYDVLTGLLFDDKIICVNCSGTITKNYVGKFLGVIKDVRPER